MAAFRVINNLNKGIFICSSKFFSKNIYNQLRHYSRSQSGNSKKGLQNPLLFSKSFRPLACQHNVTCNMDNTRQPNVVFCRNFTEDRKTTALTLIKDLKHLKSSPIPALVLGVGGVIPFAAAPAYLMITGDFLTSIAFSQVAYGACILSFLGGVRWGLTVSPDESIRPDWFNLGYSVTPSLIAWVGLLLPTPAAILTLISGLLGACYMDVTLWGYPPWFKALRFLLTFCAVLSLWTTLMCRLLMGPDKTETKKEENVVKEKRSWFRLPWKSSKPKAVMDTPEQLPTESTVKVSPVHVTPVVLEEPIVINAPLPVPEPPMDIENEEETDKPDKETKVE